VPQQLAQRLRSGSMHSRPHSHLERFQIESACPALLLEDKPQQRGYFPFDFPMDGFRRFFSCGVSVASTGRDSQISSFVSIKVRLSS
jgi:hypothetical protein